jgi:hypothetical protein
MWSLLLEELLRMDIACQQFDHATQVRQKDLSILHLSNGSNQMGNHELEMQNGSGLTESHQALGHDELLALLAMVSLGAPKR